MGTFYISISKSDRLASAAGSVANKTIGFLHHTLMQRTDDQEYNTTSG